MIKHYKQTCKHNLTWTIILSNNHFVRWTLTLTIVSLYASVFSGSCPCPRLRISSIVFIKTQIRSGTYCDILSAAELYQRA